MPLLINGIDTPPMHLRTLLNVPFRGGTTNVFCDPYFRPAAGAPVAQGGETQQGQMIRRVREAVHHIMHRIIHHAPANAAFKSLPRGQTLAQFLSTTNVFLCCDVANTSVLAASPVSLRTPSDPHEIRISITLEGFSSTGRSVEATILHELAHICGGTHLHSRSGQFGAEHVMGASRMGDQFDPTIDTVIP